MTARMSYSQISAAMAHVQVGDTIRVSFDPNSTPTRYTVTAKKGDVSPVWSLEGTRGAKRDLVPGGEAWSLCWHDGQAERSRTVCVVETPPERNPRPPMAGEPSEWETVDVVAGGYEIQHKGGDAWRWVNVDGERVDEGEQVTTRHAAEIAAWSDAHSAMHRRMTIAETRPTIERERELDEARYAAERERDKALEFASRVLGVLRGQPSGARVRPDQIAEVEREVMRKLATLAMRQTDLMPRDRDLYRAGIAAGSGFGDWLAAAQEYAASGKAWAE